MVIEYNINILKYNLLTGRSYIHLPKELDRPRKGLSNIQNINENACFKWCLVKCLNPPDHHPARIIKADKDFGKALDFKDIKFPVKVKDIHKIEKRNSIRISVSGHENIQKHQI